MFTAALTPMQRLSDSLLQLLRGAGSDASDTRSPAADQRIYRLRAWPQLEEAGRTAKVYRLLSVMSNRPVSRHWMLSRSDMPASEIDSLLHQLQEAGALEVIDPSLFTPRP